MTTNDCSLGIDRQRKILAIETQIRNSEAELSGLRKVLALSRAIQIDSTESQRSYKTASILQA